MQQENLFSPMDRRSAFMCYSLFIELAFGESLVFSMCILTMNKGAGVNRC